MPKNRLRVRQVWTGWADEIANRVVYGAFGLSRRRVKNTAAHRFLRARKRWNQYVNWLLNYEWITLLQAKRMCGCRYQGVKLNIETPKYACHYGLCPYCYYRWLTTFLKKNKSWAKSERLDVIAWTSQVKEDLVFEPAERVGALATYRSYRSALVAHARAEECQGASVCWLWPYVRDRELDIFGYTQRIIVLGRGLNRHIFRDMEPMAWLTKDEGKLQAAFDIEPSEAWNTLGYYRGWLDTPFDVGQQVIRWNQRFRARSFEGAPSSR